MTLPAQTQILTANYGTDRTNANQSEVILNTSNVAPDTFGKVASFPVDGQIYAQPLYVSGLTIKGESRNVVYVATMHNTVYALDADNPGSMAPIWKANFGPSVTSQFLDFDDIDPEVGILGTPTIDLTRNSIYFVTDTFEKDSVIFRLHSVDLTTGKDNPGSPVEISTSVAGVGDGSDGEKVAFNPKMHLQRPGLLLQNDRVYIAFGSHADTYPYHGWVFAYNADNVQNQTGVFNTTPNGSSGSIWHAGRGLATDASGNIYVGTANGDYDGDTSFSESFLKLSPDLKLLDWYTPPDWKRLSDRDRDLGSLGPVFLPGLTQFFGGDKFGNLYLMNPADMGHLDTEDAPKAQIFRPVIYGGIFNTALWNSDSGLILYAMEMGDFTANFRIVDGKFETTPLSQTPINSDIPYQGMAVSASGGAAGTGILWMTTGDHEQDDVPGTLHAFDALDLTKEIWNSEVNPDRDRPGSFAKFVSPTIANGRVYVPTFSNSLAIYGLLPTDQSAAPPPDPAVEVKRPTKAKRPVRNGQVRATPRARQ